MAWVGKTKHEMPYNQWKYYDEKENLNQELVVKLLLAKNYEQMNFPNFNCLRTKFQEGIGEPLAFTIAGPVGDKEELKGRRRMAARVSTR